MYNTIEIGPYSGQLSVAAAVADLALQPADVLKVRAKHGAILDHYAVYLGHWNHQHWFSAAMPGGVVELSEEQMEDFANDYRLTVVRRFSGTKQEQDTALNRAFAQTGRSYWFLGYNCENHANYVQTGKSWSNQTRNAGAGAMLLGAAMWAGSENERVKNVGKVTIGLGIGAILLDWFTSK